MKGKCTRCGKIRKLVCYSDVSKWAGEPDICLGCESGVQHWASGGKS